ncbi:ABC transporter substrate-binding protein [Arthrobacter oryzae]|uniref:ABC transporter substrate-binding protein n=1 Tax=Arthrobacter oryzae TaxID=409290 RepID=UPI0027813487|nr:ABC transporter substrate-binding protein [Arthrobacter oryzae]MDQ0074895.1 ABC-type nitrate/sulfonate/bicarbonate transport system substrate-binding protein [Arthrobacter oryzae]
MSAAAPGKTLLPRRTVLASAFGAATVIVLTATGCGGIAAGAGTAGNTAGEEVKTVRYQGSPNNVSLPELAQDLGFLGDVTLEWVSNTTSGPQSIQSVATSQTDIGSAFTGAVIKLIEAGAPVQAVISSYGEDDKTFTGYYVLEGSPIRTARDLIGKKIAVNTLGAHHEAVISTFLKNSGLSPEEIKQVQLVVVPPNETEQALRKKQVDAGTLGGVLQDRALAEGGVRALFTDVGVIGGPFDAGQYVIRKDFLAANPETSRKLVTGIAKAIEWERSTPREEVIAKFEEIIAKRGRNESSEALKYWKSVGIASPGGRIKDTDFTRWSEYLTSAGIIDGALDLPKLYTNEFNGLATGTETASGTANPGTSTSNTKGQP